MDSFITHFFEYYSNWGQILMNERNSTVLLHIFFILVAVENKL